MSTKYNNIFKISIIIENLQNMEELDLGYLGNK